MATMDVIAARRGALITRDGEPCPLEVRIARPEATGEGGSYRCEYHVVGAGCDNPRPARGMDSLQALERAYASAQAEIVLLECVTGGTVKWMEESLAGMGFPSVQAIRSTWGALEGDDQEALFECAMPLAEFGIAWAQGLVGMAYFSGRGVGYDPQAAVAWLTRAADQGDPSACDALAGIYYHGFGVSQDHDLAEQYRERMKYYRNQ